MTSKEALEIIRTYHNQISILCKGKISSRIINAENQIEKDLEKLEKYKIANTVFISYLTMFINDVSFDTFITSQCTEEEQEICGELLKEVLEDENNL